MKIISSILILVLCAFSAGAQSTGDIDCDDCTPVYDKEIDNSLTVIAKDNAIVVVKLIEVNTQKCVRYIFVDKGQTYETKNIPLGSYEVKFAVGNKWEHSAKKKCKLRFVDKSFFMQLSKDLSFKKTKTKDGFEYNSFDLNIGINFNSNDPSFKKIEKKEF